MKNIELDRLFREKIGNITGLPDNITWNGEKGWKDYEMLYLRKRIPTRIIYLYISAAAIILIVLTSILLFNGSGSEILLASNNTDEVMKFTLPDGNMIWLNRDSNIEYPEIFDEKHNELSVAGEVYFEIDTLPTSKYIIKANNALIEIGKPCSLNVRAHQQEENVNITVASGAIRVMEKNNPEGLTLLITEGSYCSIHKSQNLVYSSVNKNYNYLAWKTGKLIFNSMPMAGVTDILAEYYDTHIELEDKTLAYCRFSGIFENQPIETILNQIQSDLNFVVRNTGTSITISGKGCLTL